MIAVSDFLSVLTVVLAATLGYLLSFSQEKRKSREEQRRLLSVLIGELLNIKKHYAITYKGIPVLAKSPEDRIKFQMAKYGSFAMLTGHLHQIGFLTHQQISDVMQLSLSIRNNDAHIEALLLDLDRCGYQEGTLQPTRFEYLRNRMGITESRAKALIKSISQKNSKLGIKITDEDLNEGERGEGQMTRHFLDAT